ncbi:MAG: T9SS type A sorting domain-containing protein [Flavobacteriales bacterium]|nr:T9SS type A sorting domain-containing protein [Flavobacteriales bacterium]
MKKLCCIRYVMVLAGMLAIGSVCGQEFSTTLHFWDAMGHRDSVVIGHDSTATDSIDTAFGEVNLFGQPWDSVFEVRVMPNKSQSMAWDMGMSAEQKRYIWKNSCKMPQLRFGLSLMVGVKCKHFPISLLINPADFSDSCKLGSYFYHDYIPGDDVGYAGVLTPKNALTDYLYQIDTVVFNRQTEYPPDERVYKIIAGDTIPLIRFEIRDYRSHIIGVSEKTAFALLSIYPNPSRGRFNIHAPSGKQIQKVSVYTLQGAAVPVKFDAGQRNVVEMDNPEKGMFILKVAFDGGDTETLKIVVEE